VFRSTPPGAAPAGQHTIDGKKFDGDVGAVVLPNNFNIPGYFKMRSRFVGYTGYYVLHCHILAHEDRGMMTVVQVAPRPSPYSHE
jgi:FtsP/CotA-like multicopper oxidase with cupredoxin domain